MAGTDQADAKDISQTLPCMRAARYVRALAGGLLWNERANEQTEDENDVSG
jgi:hypothetical protein